MPSYYSGAFLSASDDEIVEQAEKLQKVGYAAFKIRVGMPDPKRDIERAHLIRKAYHGDLMVDAGCIFNRSGAIRAARDLAQFEPVWFEDPVSPERLTDLEAVRAASPIPIAGGELLYSESQIAEFSRRDVYDHILFDLERIGGVSGWIKSAAIADQYGLRVSAHCFPEIAIHILCGLENSYFHEQLEWSHELFAEVPRIAGGHCWPSERPGLGLEFDEDFIHKYLVEEAIVGKKSAIPKTRQK
jgi:L-alanine-DL-glutamate epimerase-like enolase superfamily enzyme